MSPTRSNRSLLALALSLIAALAAGCSSEDAAVEEHEPTDDELWVASHPLRKLKRERLSYSVTATKGWFQGGSGTLVFALSRDDADGEQQLVIQAHAQGKAGGVDFDSTITARLRDEDYVQVLSDHHRVKKSYKHRKMVWVPNGINYLKHNHCDAPALCHNPKHLITRPDGTQIHCNDKECKNPDHFVWALRTHGRHRLAAARIYGLIAALYMARGFDIRPDGPAHTLRVVNFRDIWDIVFRVEKEVKGLRVPAGTFDCYKLGITFEPAGKYTKKKAAQAKKKNKAQDFDGPFGLSGNVALYVDKQTKRAIRIQGQADIGVSINVDLQLQKIEEELLDSDASADAGDASGQ